ncbi:Protein of unknown function (DUF2628) [Serratia sp. FGI94]|uniref:DUF2628 domain-containing protein n=1 Tax=Serratia sp. FGI94 TaxID=671990 RepID=UPI0002A722AD|nr:DUF2628 domain-containing protein [Serratia sp. FGI94]AGB81563.1 Protein of unknown function (DUF2628) [Serratia sp. FGI94]
MNQYKELSSKWRERFDFFDSVGGDITSPEYRNKIKELGFFERMKYIMNFFAFFFGIIYMCILGLWKKGLVLFVGACVLSYIVAIVEYVTGGNFELAYRFLGIGYSCLCASVANYAYYLKEKRGIQGWNPFEGFSKRSAAKIAARREG